MNLPRISVLVAARKNSKYLAKFILDLYAHSGQFEQLQVLAMMSEQDEWNQSLKWYFRDNIQFYTEDKRLGRAGLHEYFNELLTHATGDWIIYFCEDHSIIMPDWDIYLRRQIAERRLDPAEPWCIVPKFDNCGAMNQVVSRGYVKALGGVLGRHGWIDSYINHVNYLAFGDHSPRLIRLDAEMFHDFTHDDPSPMSDAHLQSIVSGQGLRQPKFDSEEVRRLIAEDADKLRKAAQR